MGGWVRGLEGAASAPARRWDRCEVGCEVVRRRRNVGISPRWLLRLPMLRLLQLPMLRSLRLLQLLRLSLPLLLSGCCRRRKRCGRAERAGAGRAGWGRGADEWTAGRRVLGRRWRKRSDPAGWGPDCERCVRGGGRAQQAEAHFREVLMRRAKIEIHGMLSCLGLDSGGKMVLAPVALPTPQQRTRCLSSKSIPCPCCATRSTSRLLRDSAGVRAQEGSLELATAGACGRRLRWLTGSSLSSRSPASRARAAALQEQRKAAPNCSARWLSRCTDQQAARTRL
jgi:hypothetical protein